MPQKRADKQIFQDLQFATACPLGGQWTDTNITRWVTRRGGKYDPEVTEKTTHLICTVEEYKTKGAKVRQAAKLGAGGRCKVVTLDWLEDSLFRDKKVPVKDYLLSAVIKNERARELQAARVAKGHELADRFVNTNFYHVYADESNFFYEITLTRDDNEAGWQGQKYILYLFESNAKPHLYQFAVKFYQKPRDTQPKFHRPSETPQLFWTEYDKFKTFFQKKTGIDWDRRLVEISLDESLFQYKAPVGGKPVGYVPHFGMRQPSSLKPGLAVEEEKIKPEPGEPEEKDVKFAALLERAEATSREDGDPTGVEKQPLTEGETLTGPTELGISKGEAMEAATAQADRIDIAENGDVVVSGDNEQEEKAEAAGDGRHDGTL